MNKSSNLFVAKASTLILYLLVMLLNATQLASLANAYPGNQYKYDCYRKRNNRFIFGSSTDASNLTTLCTPNPNYKSETRSVTQHSTSTTSNTSERVYVNNYTRRDDTGAKVAIGLGSFFIGALVASPPWGWGWGWGGYGGYGGDVFIDDSINVIDYGDDLNVEVGDIGDLDASIQDVDLTEIDASGDTLDTVDVQDSNTDDTLETEGDVDLDQVQNEPDFDTGTEDMNDGDFGGDDFGGDDFGGDDFGGGDFGGDDFGGGDF